MSFYRPAGGLLPQVAAGRYSLCMLSAFILDGTGKVSTDTSPAALSAALRDPAGRFWLDMEKPTQEELGLLDEVFGFHPLAIEDVSQYVQRPKIEHYNHGGDAVHNGYFFMVIHGPDVDSFRHHVRTKELDLFVAERYIVTIHEEHMNSVGEMLGKAKADAKLVLEGGIDMLLYGILDRLVDHYAPIMDWLQERIDEMEDEALKHPSRAVLGRINVKKRELLHLRRIISPQREVVAQLTRGDVPFIRDSARIYLRDVLDHLVRVVEEVELYRDLIQGSRDLYLSSINNNLSEIMKTLTVITVIALPLTVTTGFFGMNFEYIPGLHSPEAFWVAVAVMVGIVVTMVIYFHRKRWV